jgi:hypothetical protein
MPKRSSKGAPKESPILFAFAFLCEGVSFSFDGVPSIHRMVDHIASPTTPVSPARLVLVVESHRNPAIGIDDFNALNLEVSVNIIGPKKSIEAGSVKINPVSVANDWACQRTFFELGPGLSFSSYGIYKFEISVKQGGGDIAKSICYAPFKVSQLTQKDDLVFEKFPLGNPQA